MKRRCSCESRSGRAEFDPVPAICSTGALGGLLTTPVHPLRMGRPPLGNISTHINLPQDLLDRMDAIVGPKGRSKFARQATGQLLDRLAPTEAITESNGIWESDGGHEPRLSSAGTAAVMALVRKLGFDRVMADLEFTDPLAFLNMLLGHSELQNATVTRLSQLLVAHRIKTANLG